MLIILDEANAAAKGKRMDSGTLADAQIVSYNLLTN